MFLKAGALSLALLLASRLLGLLRESALAATFGASGLGDVAVLMLTLPDWVAGVLASGALAYVLLPQWARQTPKQLSASQARVGLTLLGLGMLGGAALVACRASVVSWLASGLPSPLLPVAQTGLVWAALALPAALLAALGVTRLQHEQDFTGMYGANLVVNMLLIMALLLMPGMASALNPVSQLGAALCAAMLLRLAWLGGRLKPFRGPLSVDNMPQPTAAPAHARVWLWAALSAGLPLSLPFAARSLASGAGEGALASFNYAWKLVELPLMLAIQLVATLAFPAITRALGQGAAPGALTPAARQVIRSALALAWTLACAAVVALQIGAAAIADLLFGWGRMDAAALDQVAAWGRVAAWGLLPQALIAVAVTVLASQQRLGVVVVAYSLALGGLLAWGGWSGSAGVDGAALMGMLNLLFGALAAVLLGAMVWPVRQPGTDVTDAPLGLIAWSAVVVPALVLTVICLALPALQATPSVQKGPLVLMLCALAALVLIAISARLSPVLRQALRR